MPYGFDKCPECGSVSLNTFRHMGARVWCNQCDHTLRPEQNLTIPQRVPTEEEHAFNVIINSCMVDSKCKYCSQALESRIKGHTHGCIVTQALVERVYTDNHRR